MECPQKIRVRLGFPVPLMMSAAGRGVSGRGFTVCHVAPRRTWRRRQLLGRQTV